MKRDFLENLGLEKEVINKIMEQNGKDIESHKKEAQRNKEELEGIKEQLKSANTEIQSYKDLDIESIKASVEEWKTKYENETNALNDKLKNQEYDYSLKEALSKYDFASERIKKSVFEEIKSKEFKLDNGNFLGLNDYMENLKKEEPTAFNVTTPVTPSKTGSEGNFKRVGSNQMTKEEFSKLSYKDRVELFNTNQELYNQLNE